MLKSSPDRYGTVAVSIHWLTAILIVVLLGSGFNAADSAESAAKAQFLRVHIPVAIVVLLLTIFRVVWWIIDTRPRPVAGMPLWQERLSRLVHFALYAVIFIMAASGIGMMALSGAAPAVFGQPGAILPDFHDYAPRGPHGLGANLLILLLIAHIGAALYHHFIRRDGLMSRMWYRRQPGR